MPDIPVWPACDADCVFCSNPGGEYRRPTAEHSLETLVGRLTRYKAGLERFHKFNDARDVLTLTGGEPTHHPRFLAFLSAARRQYPAALLRLLTHGRRLADAAFTRQLLAVAGEPFEVEVNLTGPSKGLPRALSGIRHLLALRRSRQRVIVRLVLTRTELASLPRTMTLFGALRGLDGAAVLFPEFEGRALRSADVTGLRFREAAAALARVEPPVPLSLYHFPLCVLPERLRPLARRTLDDAKVVFSLCCRDCALRPRCVGIHKSYARLAGCAEFVPEAA